MAPDSESSDFEEIQEERGSSSFDSLQDNRATINSKFDLLFEKLGTIDDRIALLESNHKKLEERLSSPPSFSSPSSSDASQRRKRATPVALQVNTIKICIVLLTSFFVCVFLRARFE